ncbi:MAG: 5'-3' exonuclease [Chloroflexota bacterium]
MDVLLLDGYNLLFRSFTSLPDSITDSHDQPINAVYGMLGTIVRLVRERQPDRVVVAMDEPGTPVFRALLYPPYQAQRGPLGGDRSDDFARQVTIAGEILPSVGIAVMSVAGYEADDVMGTLAWRTANEGGRATIVSTDRDLIQLIRKGVQVLNPRGEGQLIATEAEAREVFGIAPALIPAYKALAGDASDNYPGIARIGAKTAAGLVERYGGLDAIFAHLEELAAAARNALQGRREQAALFERIATIVTELELEGDMPALGLPDGARPRSILNEAGY